MRARNRETGREIVGTLDVVQVTAQIERESFRQGEVTESVAFDYFGASLVDWDSQETCSDEPTTHELRINATAGGRIFVDEDGDLVHERDVELFEPGQDEDDGPV